jgi:DNA-binding winged helix-turn-helix (wHTH) protein
MTARLAFEDFVLDPRERRLQRAGQTVELNGRYFDALALLASEAGSLVSKDRFLQDVWRGVPVTDEALTQCIRTLRRELGDDAARPRFIETVPKHGYRFIASVQRIGDEGPAQAFTPLSRKLLPTAVAGTTGGAVAGAVGGLIYGFLAATSQSATMGSLSVLLVMLCVITLVAILGAAGISLGIAASMLARRWSLLMAAVGGAAGGLVVGALGNMLGHDAFALLVGQSPGNITGGPEGALIGAAVGIGAWFGDRAATPARAGAYGAISGAIAGIATALLGGRLMLGSLELLVANVPASKLKLDAVTKLIGGSQFGLVSNGFEGALFAGCIVAAMRFYRRPSGAAEARRR